MFGPEAIAQVDLGTREHRNRSLQSLSVQAAEVMATMLTRAGVEPAGRDVDELALAPSRRLAGAAESRVAARRLAGIGQHRLIRPA